MTSEAHDVAAMTIKKDPTHHIEARIRDIEPNGAKPRLELYFDAADEGSLASHHGAELELTIEGVTWVGTVGLRPPNPPYMHTRLRGASGGTRVSDVLLDMELAPGAKIRFEVLEPGRLRLEQVLDRGRWPARARPSNAAARAIRAPRPAPKPPSSPAVTAAQRPFPLADSAAIERWAARYWDLIASREKADEQAFEREMPAHRARGYLDKDIFVRLARWKSVRKTPDYESNAERAVESSTRRAFAAGDDAAAIQALTELRGVALRTATALLHWMRPERFPILDFRVVAALGVAEPSNWESGPFYAQVADRIRSIASSAGVDLRTLDRALWAWDKAGGVG